MSGTGDRRRRWKLALSGLLVLVGIAQLGWGVYIQAKAWLAQRLLLYAWERAEQGESQPRPWSWADTWPVARLQVERLGIDQILLAGASGRTLAFGPGHLTGTARPGTPGHSLVSGHRDTHFAFLRELVPGDQLRVLLPDGRTRSYAVAGSGVYHRDQLWLLDQPELDRLTLVTCYPFDAVHPGGPLRYVVQAEP